MEIFNYKDNNYKKYLKDFEFSPNQYTKDIKLTQNFLNLENTCKIFQTKPITLKTNQSTKNMYNYFYYEIENISKKWLAFGFADKTFENLKTVGLSKNIANFGIIYKDNKITIYSEKILHSEEKVNSPQVIGIGFFCLTSSLFITVDGKLLKEMPFIRINTECDEFFPHVSLKSESHVCAKFIDIVFDIDNYVKLCYEKFDKMCEVKDLRGDNVDFLVKDYLKQNGFEKTLESLSGKRYKKIKKKVSRSFFDSEKEINLDQFEVESIRESVILKKNWDFVLDLDKKKKILNKRLKANIIFIQFLEKYNNSIDETEKLNLFSTYEKRFKEIQEEKIYLLEQPLKDLILDIILNDNIEAYLHLLNIEHKNNMIGYIFKTNKNNRLNKILNHLIFLLKYQAKSFNLNQGFDLKNIQI